MSSAQLFITLTVTGEKPATGCLPIPGYVRPDLIAGKRRLLLTFMKFSPTDSGGSAFELSTRRLPDSQQPEVPLSHGSQSTDDYHLLHVFAIHPVTRFDVASGVQPHRFLLSLKPYADVLESLEFCFQLQFADQSSRGGSATLSVEWSPLL